VTAFAAALAVLSLFALASVFATARVIPPLPADPPEPPGGWPMVSVVVPARDEERDVERAIVSHLECDYPAFEVIVVDDRSVDSTPRILGRLAAEHPRMMVVSGEEPPPGWLGKPHALREGARHANGRWLLFADADVLYGRCALRSAVSVACRQRLDHAALLPRFVTQGFWEAVLMPNLYAVVYLGGGFLLNRDRQGTWAIGGGAGNLIARDAYDAIGGHEALRDRVIDDVALATEVRRSGLKSRGLTAFDSVTVRMYRGFSEIFEGFTKNLGFMTDSAVPLIALVAGSLLLALAPYALLFSGKAPVRLLAVAAIVLTFLGRAAASRITRMPVWASLFHPVMVAVWGAMAVRSIWRRWVQGRVVWRGRSSPARDAR
jgi:cellulose synthase/poly-beta-1,6-N-acetylglucosamine synthase-like glycosyltransferase